LLSQEFEHWQFEIIAIHDGRECDYDMAEIERLGAVGNFRFFTIDKGGAGEARNFGISQAQGRYILMTDDDCVAASDWVSTMTGFMDTHPEMVAVGGQVLAVQPETYVQSYIKFKNLLRRPVRNVKGEIVTLITANVIYRKEVLEKMSGFSQLFRDRGISCGGEDLDLAFRAKKYGHLGYCESAIVFHHHRSTLSALTRQHFNYGRGVFIACVNNGISYEELNFSRPTAINIIKHWCLSCWRLYSVSIPEYREKGLRLRHYLPYFFLDLLRRNVFMVGAVYEFYSHGGDGR